MIRKIRTVLTKGVLDKLTTMASEKPDEYSEFYKQFGQTLKEGIAVDPSNRERVARLLRFASSRAEDGSVLTGLDDYLKRAPEDARRSISSVGPTWPRSGKVPTWRFSGSETSKSSC